MTRCKSGCIHVGAGKLVYSIEKERGASFNATIIENGYTQTKNSNDARRVYSWVQYKIHEFCKREGIAIETVDL